ncbi:Gfo/Idh/MocA family protein [Deinococcus sp.]|uniref:Gfo/Idh/MocA family protein n=1 Tax=Deinococcus sp. TaxID=47478 RepID=UPI003CC5DDA6
MKPVRLGFIGAGWWATANHMPLLKARDDVEFVGVASLGAGQLRQVQDMFGFPFATEDYRELLKQDLDAVVVTTPHHLHYEHALASVERGLHVMVEKPFTLRPDQAWRLVEAAKSRGVELLIPYGWHYRPYIQALKTALEGAPLGELQFAVCTMASPTRGLFAGRADFSAFDWKPTLFEADPRTWQTPEIGGGYAHGQITHSSALLFWLTGLRSARVSARLSRAGATVDLYGAAQVEFEGGVIGTVSGAATLPDGDAYQIDLRVFGSEGVLLLDVERERAEIRRHDGQHVHIPVTAGEGAYLCDVPPVRFIEVIRGRGRNDSPGEVGARTAELIEAMHRSSAQGGVPVEVYRPAPHAQPEENA